MQRIGFLYYTLARVADPDGVPLEARVDQGDGHEIEFGLPGLVILILIVDRSIDCSCRRAYDMMNECAVWGPDRSTKNKGCKFAAAATPTPASNKGVHPSKKTCTQEHLRYLFEKIREVCHGVDLPPCRQLLQRHGGQSVGRCVLKVQ
jgi:hypothetical protein